MEKNSLRLFIRVTPKMKEEIERHAERRFQNASEYIREAVVDKLIADA